LSINEQILSREILQSRIDKIERLQIAHLPTPPDFCPRLTAALGGPQIWTKRDDGTSLAFGGNKTPYLKKSWEKTISDKSLYRNSPIRPRRNPENTRLFPHIFSSRNPRMER
jgi:hypothetical protein